MKQKAIKLKRNELTSKELEMLFGATTMTVVNWRKGSARITPLPHKLVPVKEGERHRVLFSVAKVRAWAKKNGLEFVRQPEDVIALRT